MQNLVYVDSFYGSNANTGSLLKPVATLTYAYSIVYEGGVIVLQTGSTVYTLPQTITKNISIVKAAGTSPQIGALTVLNAQCFFEGLIFASVANPLTITCPNFGAVLIKECVFSGSDTAVYINSAAYVSLHKNLFKNFNYGIKIRSAKEVCISSNVFTSLPADQSFRSVDVDTVERIDIWGNTVNGASSFGSSPTPDLNLRIVYKTLSNFDILYKRVSLPTFANTSDINGYDVVVNMVNGSSYLYGSDYIVTGSGSIVSWSGLGLDGQLQIGDILRIEYSEGGTVGAGDALRLLNVGDPNSRVDSNSFSGKMSGVPAAMPLGIFFNTSVKIRHNNFYNTTTFWSGSIPTGATGLKNLSTDPKYVDPNTANFRLMDVSPNIDAGDPGRWTEVYNEMGIYNVGSGYTASGASARANVAPFNRNKDFLDFDRGVTGIVGVTGDIGAYEFNPGETALGNYVAENGYDISNPGTATRPYATLDRGFARGATGIRVHTNFMPYEASTGVYTMSSYTGVSVSRYHSGDMVLSDGCLQIGSNTKNDMAVIYPAYSRFETGVVYVSPDGNDRYTGTSSSPLRTIAVALSKNPSYVAVMPGVYPSFKGVSGIRVIGVEQDKIISFSKPLYSNFMEGSWTGPGDYKIAYDKITSTSSNVMSNFKFYGDIDLKFEAMIGISGVIQVGIKNSSDVISVLFDTNLGSYCVSYSETGSSYAMYQYLGTTSVAGNSVGINLTGNTFTVDTRGSAITNTFTNSLDYGYTGPWSMFINIAGITGLVKNIQLSAEGFTGGVTGTSYTEIRHKSYTLIGATGLVG